SLKSWMQTLHRILLGCCFKVHQSSQTASNLKEMNQTELVEFLLLGFQELQMFKAVVIVIFLLVYIFTLVVNILIIILVTTVESLQSPMYLFLSQVSLSDILMTTIITPNMIHVIIIGGSKISIGGCITQFYFYGASTGTELLLFMVMSYDRYLAICNPLHYSSIMNYRLSFHLVLWSWIFSSTIMFILVFLIANLQFCGSDNIDHYFCDLAPLLEMSCSDNTFIELLDMLLTIIFGIIPFVFILFTYICISITIAGIPSTSGKQKAFSTCSSHLTVVCMYYGTIILVYTIPSKGRLFNIKKMLSTLYTIGTPFFNPIIYSFRNQEIKIALIKHVTNWGDCLGGQGYTRSQIIIKGFCFVTSEMRDDPAVRRLLT
ncbi:hypothetical protein XELAEV_18019472mg, partial [Pelobates cultripes]